MASENLGTLRYSVDQIRQVFNPYVRNGLSHPYCWMSPLSFLGASVVVFLIFISFLDENLVSKQNSPRWAATFCGVTSGANLFTHIPSKGCQTYMG